MIKPVDKKDRFANFFSRLMPSRIAYWCHIRMANEWSKEGLSVDYTRNR